MEMEMVLDTNIKDASFEIEALTQLKEVVSDVSCDFDFKRKLEREIDNKIEELEQMKEVYINDLIVR